MAFVSRNPKAILNPETANDCVSVEPKNLEAGVEFIGFYKNCFVDSAYNNKCYVFKSKENGKDYLFYGSAALHSEMAYYVQGDLLSIRYEGEKIAKKGKFAGKPFHAWKVGADDTWVPSPEFIAQLQAEVQARRIEVQNILGQRTPSFAAATPAATGFAPAANPFGQASPRKIADPFG